MENSYNLGPLYAAKEREDRGEGEAAGRPRPGPAGPQADPSIPGYPATTGWDPVTGLGTPDAATSVPALAAG